MLLHHGRPGKEGEDMLLHGGDVRRRLCLGLDLDPGAVLVLEVLRGPDALEAPVDHDGELGAEGLALVHAV